MINMFRDNTIDRALDPINKKDLPYIVCLDWLDYARVRADYYFQDGSHVVDLRLYKPFFNEYNGEHESILDKTMTLHSYEYYYKGIHSDYYKLDEARYKHFLNFCREEYRKEIN